MVTEEEGKTAVKTARHAVESSVKKSKFKMSDLPESFEKEMGVFVTINKYPSGDLRGCIGYPEPYFKLKKALVQAAVSATEDPRFLPLAKEELDEITIEVTILTPPEKIDFEDPSELPKKISCGEDGLIISRGPYKGLLLPQVPVKHEWDEEEFLSHTCMKAGLNGRAWKEGGCTVERFRGEIYAETEPSGKIVRKG